MKLQFDIYARGGGANYYYWTLSEVLLPENVVLCTSPDYASVEEARNVVRKIRDGSKTAKVVEHIQV
jgi:hypothetical protein